MSTAVLIAMVVAFASSGDERVAPLVEQLKSPHPGVRGRAAMNLGELGSLAREAVKPLAAVMADEDLNVRYWAASALRAIGPEAGEAVPALIGALRTSFPGRGLKGPPRYYPDVRAVSAEALGALGTAARMAVPALKEALSDKDESVRAAAAAALKMIEAGGEAPNPQ